MTDARRSASAVWPSVDVNPVSSTIAAAMAAAAIALRTPVLNFDDFESYTAAVSHAIAGIPIYSAVQLEGPYRLQDLAEGRGFIYPPTAVPLLLPSLMGNLAGLAILFLGLALLAYVVAALVRHELPGSGALGTVVAAILLLSPAAGDAIYVAQITPFIAAGYGLSWLVPKLAGWLAVAGGLIKVFPLALVVWALRERRMKLMPILLGMVVIGVTTLWLGPTSWTDFINAWRNARPQCGGPSLGSLWCQFGDVGRLIGVVGAVAILVSSFVLPWRSVAFAAIAVASVIAAPDIFPNYLLVIVVALLPAAAKVVAHLHPDWSTFRKLEPDVS